MIGAGPAYLLAGAVFAAAAAATLARRGHPRRLTNSLFWALLAASFWFGERLGDLGNGLLALSLVGLGGLRGLKREAEDPPEPSAAVAPTPGAAVFAPVLIVPAAAFAGALALGAASLGGQPLVAKGQAPVDALALGVVVALPIALRRARAAPPAAAGAARRLLEGVGAAAVLPQMLAALGAVFALAGVGKVVGGLLDQAPVLGAREGAVAAYGLGMWLFTLIMGNAFAAAPVMIAAVGAPVLVGRFHGDPAAVGALGMLCGYCGTLMTPMAAHNIVPAALLRLSPWAVIRAQTPTALAVLAANLVLLDLLAFRR